jgi:hypothetical protein
MQYRCRTICSQLKVFRDSGSKESVLRRVDVNHLLFTGKAAQKGIRNALIPITLPYNSDEDPAGAQR